MNSKFKITTVATTLAAACIGVMAGPIGINFDHLGVVNDQSGVPIEGPFKEQNVTIKGAYAYAPGMLDGFNDPGPEEPLSGFIANRGRPVEGAPGSGNPGTISIELDEFYTSKNQFFKSVSMKMWSPGEITISWLNAALDKIESKKPTFGGATTVWSTILTPSASAAEAPWNQLTRVASLSITAGDGVLALDDLSIELTAGTTSPAPEPASYALVAVALIAAGAASRSRHG